jgi:thioredoxin-related protein
MNRMILGVLLAAALCSNALAQHKEGASGWLTDHAAATQLAKQQGKHLLMLFTGSDWCGFCIKLRGEVLDTPEFKEFAARKAVLLEIDFPRRKRLPKALVRQNDRLQREYEVEGFPTIAVLNSQGKLLGGIGYEEGGPKKWLASTPHHHDCWEYWGRCATYACTGLQRDTGPPAPPDEPAQLEVRASGRARYLPRRPLAESHRALLYSRAGSYVRLDDDEVALQLPPDMALELPMLVHAGGWTGALGAFALIVSTVGGSLRMLFRGRDLVGELLVLVPIVLWTWFTVRLRARRRSRHAPDTWLIQDGTGTLIVETHEHAFGGRLRRRFRHPLVVPGTGGRTLRARGVLLRPAHGEGEEARTVKAYRLQLSCELPDQGLDLIVPLAVPAKGEPRQDFLKELSSLRALGRQIAALFRVPYVELGKERSKDAQPPAPVPVSLG